ncbi:MAG: 2-dehydropantoate 2-reductase [Gammaproteobacteria bacterium]|nr:MAG: 2-dehydropantoate 2-reductase [Gammaproteobacteria bacterium]
MCRPDSVIREQCFQVSGVGPGFTCLECHVSISASPIFIQCRPGTRHMPTFVNPVSVCVLGAGAIGCFVGGCLARHGHRVTLLGRPRYGEAVRAHGLHVAALNESPTAVPRQRYDFVADAKAHGTALNQANVILVCVKSGATAAAADQIRAHAPESALVISLQNGVHNADRLREALPHRVLAGMVPFNVEHTSPGHFRQLTTGHLYIERPTDEAQANLVQSLMGPSPLSASLETDMKAIQWSKLILNLNNAVNALSGLPLREMLLDPGYRRILAAAQSEAVRLLRRKGQRLVRLGALYPPLLPHLLRLPTPLFRLMARSAIAIDPEARSSMQADLRSGRLTEVDELNGEIVRLAEALGDAAPVNQALVTAVHEAERAGHFIPIASRDLRKRITLHS